MKILILLITLTISIQIYGEENCTLPTNLIEIKNCYDSTLINKDSVKIKIEQTIVLLSKKIVFVKKEDQKAQAFFGINSSLFQPIHAAISEPRNEIAVINKNKNDTIEILIFSLSLNGNVKPFRVIQSTRLRGSTSVYFDSNDSEIIVLNNNSKTAYQFNANANSLSFKKELHPVATTSDFEQYFHLQTK